MLVTFSNARVGRRRRLFLSSALSGASAAFVCLLVPAGVHAEPAPTSLPEGGIVTAGDADISTPSANRLLITQRSNKAILNWNSFNIAEGHSVHFSQPDSNSAALNRITGDAPSILAGALTADGRVLLVNPNGIAITETGTIDAGAFVASTLNIADADFLAGKLTFRQERARGVVSNAGRVTASQAVAFLGAGVVNEGVVTAKLGRIGYGAGDLITLDFAGDNFLYVALPVETLEGVTDAFGRPLRAVIEAGGTTSAEGGRIILSARAAEHIMMAAVHVPGNLAARTVRQEADGTIRLGNGSVSIEGFNHDISPDWRFDVPGPAILEPDVVRSGSMVGASASGGLALNNSAGEPVRSGIGIVTIDGGTHNVSLSGSIDVSGPDALVGGAVRIDTGATAFITGAIDVRGSAGGTIAIAARNVLSASTLDASGREGAGGTIALDASGKLVATAASLLRADGSDGGSVTLSSGQSLFTSGAISALGHSGKGGDIRLNGGAIRLAAAGIDASGQQQGGTISIGFAGAVGNPEIGADLIDLNPATTVRADALGVGQGGTIGLWSKESTASFGTLSARGGPNGGDGGFIEVSSVGAVSAGGDISAAAPGGGKAGTFLLDPKTIIIDDVAGSYPSYDLFSPSSSANDQFGDNIVTLDNGNVAVTAALDDFGAIDAGTAFLFNAKTGALISALYGSQANDQVGGNGVVALSNGNYVVSSVNWNSTRGAMTWGSGTSGVAGTVSAANSLVGSNVGDFVGSGITLLSNGNYVVRSSTWNGNRGAVT